jgi:2-phospho-L-lactate guanylyltransferase
MSGFEVLVPVKRLALAKQRLSGVIDAPARADLMSGMLANVLQALARAPLVDRLFVVTPDPWIANLAKGFGAEALPDCGQGLNFALRSAVAERRAEGAKALALFQGDLPGLTTDAVDCFLALAPAPGSAALVSDQHGRGTSAIAWRGPPHPSHFAFGVDSFPAHAALLRAAGLDLTTLGPTDSFNDLDDSGDLALFNGDDFAVLMPARHEALMDVDYSVCAG